MQLWSKLKRLTKTKTQGHVAVFDKCCDLVELFDFSSLQMKIFQCSSLPLIFVTGENHAFLFRLYRWLLIMFDV